MLAHQVTEGLLVDAQSRVLDDLDTAGDQCVSAEHERRIPDVHRNQYQDLKLQETALP